MDRFFNPSVASISVARRILQSSESSDCDHAVDSEETGIAIGQDVFAM